MSSWPAVRERSAAIAHSSSIRSASALATFSFMACVRVASAATCRRRAATSGGVGGGCCSEALPRRPKIENDRCFGGAAGAGAGACCSFFTTVHALEDDIGVAVDDPLQAVERVGHVLHAGDRIVLNRLVGRPQHIEHQVEPALPLDHLAASDGG
eukprot:6068699-Prymnesium_polylepis.3